MLIQGDQQTAPALCLRPFQSESCHRYTAHEPLTSGAQWGDFLPGVQVYPCRCLARVSHLVLGLI